MTTDTALPSAVPTRHPGPHEHAELSLPESPGTVLVAGLLVAGG